jgi:hypothetical protein
MLPRRAATSNILNHALVRRGTSVSLIAPRVPYIISNQNSKRSMATHAWMKGRRRHAEHTLHRIEKNLSRIEKEVERNSAEIRTVGADGLETRWDFFFYY